MPGNLGGIEKWHCRLHRDEIIISPALSFGKTVNTTSSKDMRTRTALATSACRIEPLVALSLLVASSHVQADILEPWTVTTPNNFPNNLYSVCFGPNGFVAVGDWGAIRTSVDGMDWTSQDSGADAPLLSVAVGNGRYIALNGFGTSLVSTDAVNWQEFSIPAGYTRIEFIEERFIGVGVAGRIAESPDGIQWDELPRAPSLDLYSITYGNGTYVIAGQYGYVFASTNLSGWQRGFVAPENLRDVVFANGKFTLFGDQNIVAHSTNGLNWTRLQTGIYGDHSAAAHADGNYVALKFNGSIVNSTNGNNWFIAKSDAPPEVVWRDVAYGLGRWIAVGELGITSKSTEGAEWSLCDPSLRPRGYVEFGNDAFVAGQWPQGVTVSTDGEHWTGTSNSLAFNRVVFAKDRFLGLGYYPAIHASSNGFNWASNSIEQAFGGLFGAAYGNSRFVAVGPAASMFSEDGVAWTKSDITSGGVDVCFGNGLFVSVFGGIESSSDGNVWEPNLLPPEITYVSLSAVAFGNDQFIAVGGGLALTSRDGRNWLQVSIPGYPYLTDIFFDRGRFIAVGRHGSILISSDGSNWGAVQKITDLELSGVVRGGNNLVAVGNGFSIRSHPVVRLSSFLDTENLFHMRITGPDQASYRLDASEDFSVWVTKARFSSIPSQLEWTEPAVGQRRFFRLLAE